MASFGKLAFLDVLAVQDDAGVERQQPLGRGQQRVDVDFLDPALLDHELAEADQQLLERGQVDRLAAAHALERLVDLGLLHHAARQGGVERRQGQRAVLEDLDQLSAQAEQQHRPELRVEAGADDDLVAFQLDHRLHGDAHGNARRRPSR